MENYKQIHLQKLSTAAAADRYLLACNGRYYEAGAGVAELLACLQTHATEAEAVATLMRDCGYAVDMSYTTGGSGAVTAKAVGALFEHFKYSPGMQFRQRNVYSKETWTRMIRAGRIPLHHRERHGRSRHRLRTL